MEHRDYKERWISFVHDLQDQICEALEKADGEQKFHQDLWVRPEGGGGRTRVISNGKLFEKGGVNTSTVYGEVTDAMRAALKLQDGSNQTWFACGISLVLHPLNPFVPTVHCNYRMFELYDSEKKLIDRWFGGGTDLTPYYIDEEDIRHFHRTYKEVCDRFDPGFYPEFKAGCDNYFVNTHRAGERRGVGGIFYDYKRGTEKIATDLWFEFGQACGNAFLPSYLPIIEKNKDLPYSAEQRNWQLIRRGRYIEFNLVHDRGTLFGLKTNGRIESILMSLPPLARFDYNDKPAAGTEESKLLEVCMHPKDWIPAGTL